MADARQGISITVDAAARARLAAIVADRNRPQKHGQLDLRPLQIAQLGRPQAVAIADQDHSRVPMAVAAGLPGGRHQALDLGRRQILAGTN